MKNEVKILQRKHEPQRGFSTLELVIVVAIILIVTGVAMPSFLQSYRTYQLNDGATRVANVMKFARYEAIRQNKAISARVLPGGPPNSEVVFVDANADGVAQLTENQTMLYGKVNLVPAATPPGTTALAAAIGVPTLTAVSLSAGAVAFDQRGAIVPAAVDVLYVGNTAFPGLGYRAVILLPSGSVQIWSTTDNTGNWLQLN